MNDYDLEVHNYDMLVARMEPENSVEMILDGVAQAGLNRPFLVIGCGKNDFSNYLRNKFKQYANIRFYDGIYNMEKLNNLRYYSNMYFHGHTVGGTNPSLLEAMASNALVCAHNNKFNSAVLNDDGLYFANSAEVAQHLAGAIKSSGAFDAMLQNNLKKIRDVYSISNIVTAYEAHFEAILRKEATVTPMFAPQPNVALVAENS